MKNYTTWLKTAAVFQLMTAAVHILSFFENPVPANDTEKQLFTLMDSYHLDFGNGFHRTINEIMIPLSASLILLCLFAGLVNLYLIRKKAGRNLMRGIMNINLLIFGIFFIVVGCFAFLLPMIFSGLILFFLLLARFTPQHTPERS
jgi:hypothetical protein